MMGFDGRIRIYLTLRCNLQCPYCVNRALPEFKPGIRPELTPNEWIGILNRAGTEVVITGGEPFLYPNVVDIINSVSADRWLGLYTNLSCVPEDFLSRLKRRIRIRATFHPHGTRLEDFVETVRRLAPSKKINGTIHLIEHLGDPLFESAAAALSDLPWKFRVECDQRMQWPELSSGHVSRHVKCASKIIIVGPTGRRYPCVACLLTGRLPQEDLVHEPLQSDWVEVECRSRGRCAPCDGITERRLTFLDEGN